MRSSWIQQWVVGVAAVAAAGTAPAITVSTTPVHLEGTLWSELGAPGLPGPGFPQTLVVDMTVPALTPGSFVAWPSGFTLSEVPAQLEVHGRVVDDTAFQAHWFGGASPGVDFRFADVFEPGDQLQVVLFFGVSPFEGSSDAPVLTTMNRGGGGFVYWFRAEEDGVDLMYSGRYQAGLVPEPGSLLLTLTGALVLAVPVSRRRRPAPATGHSPAPRPADPR